MFYQVFIETTNECNRRCYYCPISKDKDYKPMRMKTELFHRIIDELHDTNISRIVLANYGEPLLDDRLEEFIRYIKERMDVEIKIFSNGDFLTQERLQSLINSGIDKIRISQHRYNTVRCNFPTTNHVEYQKLRLERQGGVNVNNPYFRSRYCRNPSNTLIIRVDGKVPLCCIDYSNTVLLGNLKTQTIGQIWNNPTNKARRRRIARGILHDEICKKCTGLV